jgi:hypothetical protein
MHTRSERFRPAGQRSPAPMKRLSIITRLFFAACVAFICALGGGAYSQVTAQRLPKGLESVVRLFAGSHILGTGASHFVTSIHPVDENNAVAMVGETSSDGRDPNAYTVYAKRINQRWKIVRYEFVFTPTGKKISKDQIPPFPYPNWRNDAP